MSFLSNLLSIFQKEYINKIANDLRFPLVKPIGKNVRLLCIADTHGNLKGEHLETIRDTRCDACFLLGDVSHKDLQLLDSVLDKSKTYGILGNHDDFGLLEKMGIKNIHLKTVDVKGLTVLGFEGSHRYKDGAYPMYTQEEADELLKDMPATDIFVTHDSSFEALATNQAHCGFKAILGLLKEKGIPLHIHGHLHDRQQYSLDNGTSCICVYKAALIETDPVSVSFLF